MIHEKPPSLARAYAHARIHDASVIARVAQQAPDCTRRIAPQRVDPPPAEQPKPVAVRPDPFLQAITRRLRG